MFLTKVRKIKSSLILILKENKLYSVQPGRLECGLKTVVVIPQNRKSSRDEKGKFYLLK